MTILPADIGKQYGPDTTTRFKHLAGNTSQATAEHDHRHRSTKPSVAQNAQSARTFATAHNAGLRKQYPGIPLGSVRSST